MFIFAGLIFCQTSAMQSNARELDGFLTNVSNLKVTVSFELRRGRLSAKELRLLRAHGSLQSVAFLVENKRKQVSGNWSTDGTTQRYEVTATADVLAEDKLLFQKGQREFDSCSPRVVLLDQKYALRYEPGFLVVDSMSRTESMSALVRAGPFVVWYQLLPEYLDKTWRNAPVASDRVEDANGHAVRSLNWKRIRGESEETLWAAFDCNCGYLPRVMVFASMAKGGGGSVLEYFLLKSERTSDGCYVPVEWIETQYSISSYKEATSTLDAKNRFIEYPREDVAGAYFRGKLVRQDSPDLSIREPKGFRQLQLRGRIIELSQQPKKLEIEEIRRLIDAAPTLPALAPPKPHLAEGELKPVQRASSRFYPVLAVLGFCVTIGFSFKIRKVIRARDARAAVIVFVVLCGPGCTRQTGKMHVAIKAEFAAPILFAEAGQSLFETELILSNVGDVEVVVRKVLPSCACTVLGEKREVAALPPGKSISVPLSIQRDPRPERQQIPFVLETNLGPIECRPEICLISREIIKPRNLFVEIEGNDNAEVEFAIEQCRYTTDLIPDQKIVLAGSTLPRPYFDRSQDGPIDGLHFRERRFKVMLKGNEHADSFRKLVRIEDVDGKLLDSAVIHVRKTATVSSVPEIVRLARSKVRVLLRCKETLKIIGIETSVPFIIVRATASNEIQVERAKGSPGEFDAEIVIKTNVVGGEVLRIPVRAFALEQ